jgi:hypothetical protein
MLYIQICIELDFKKIFNILILLLNELKVPKLWVVNHPSSLKKNLDLVGFEPFSFQ